MPCRIAFERGKERHFCFLAISAGTSGWLVLAEELPMKKLYGVIRVAAPLAGCNVCIFVCHLCIFILNQVVWLADNNGTNFCCWFRVWQRMKEWIGKIEFYNYFYFDDSVYNFTIILSSFFSPGLMINTQDGYICGSDHLLYLFWILPSSTTPGN